MVRAFERGGVGREIALFAEEARTGAVSLMSILKRQPAILLPTSVGRTRSQVIPRRTIRG
jgi:hypothetical protein